MIQRINLLERKRIRITYGALVLAMGVAVAFCLTLYGFQALGQKFSKDQIAKYNKEIEALKIERDQLMAKEEFGEGSGPFMEVQKGLYVPPWPRVLNSVASSLPPNVWLASFKSYNKEGDPSKKGVLLNGQAKNPQTMTQFLNTLVGNPYFENVLLTTSKDEDGVWNFSVSCDISKEGFR